MINKHLNIILKLLFLIILLLFACQPAKSQSSTGAIHALPTEITLSGRLCDGDSIGEIGMPNAYLFAIANDYKTILGYSKTKNGVYPERGSWEITRLPVNKEIILVGFHPNTKFNWVIREIKTGIFNIDFGDFIIKAGPYHDPEFGGGKTGVGLFNLIAHEAGVFILDSQLKNQENLIEYLLNEAKKLDNETEITEIKNVIHNLFQALNDLDWDNAKNCCVYRSMAYDQVNRIEETLYITLGNNLSLNVSKTIDKIVIDGENAKAYLLLTSIQSEERTNNEEWFYLQKINNSWKLYRMGPVKKDSIKILSLTPNSGLEDGVKTKFKIIVEYNLTSYNKGKLDIGFSTINPANWKTIESETFYISKGSGTHEFNIHVIPKNWGKQGVFSVNVSIDEVPKSDNICLDSDLEILSF